MKKTKTRAIIDFLFPGAFSLILLVCDVFLYPITKEQYVLFGINSDLVAGLTLLLIFHLIPMVWIFILLYKEDGI